MKELNEEFNQLLNLVKASIKDEFQNQKELLASNGELLTIKQVCQMLQCSEVTLWNWENRKILCPTRIGRTVRYRKSDIDNLINKNK